jgi:hypothetical protein
MSWLHRFERRLEPFALTNVSLYIVIAQVFLLFAGMFQLLDVHGVCTLVPVLVTEGGDWWRIFTFAFIPPFPGSAFGAVFVAFGLYCFYLFGTALENRWGVVRFNLFLLTGYALTVGLAFVTPMEAANNVFLAGSVFLAFAYIFPDFTMSLFFIIPVKIKWLAVVAWVLYAYQFFTGDLSAKLGVLAATGNFLLFFSRDLWLDMKQGRRRMEMQSRLAGATREEDEPRHRCHVCGKTDLTNPEMDFRYCSKCAGDQCYCPEHIRNHEHAVVDETVKK